MAKYGAYGEDEMDYLILESDEPTADEIEQERLDRELAWADDYLWWASL